MRAQPTVDALLLLALVLTSPGLGSGPAELSPKALELRQLAAQHDVGPDYALSAALLQDNEVMQRATEMLWPRRRREAGAAHLFALADEALPSNCTAQARATWIQYAACR